MGFCGGCARALLIIFNIVFWLSGACILGVGIWMLVDKNINSYFNLLVLDNEDPYFKYAAYILIAFGAFVFIVGFCGCCGAIRNSKCLLGLYIFFLVIIFAGELAAGVLMAVYRTKIEAELNNMLQEQIRDKYATSPTIAQSWNFIQIELACCGATGPDDYQQANTTYNATKFGNYPMSCCVLSNSEEAMKDPSKAAAKDDSQCMANTEGFIHKEGCSENVMKWMKDHSTILIGVGIGIAMLQLFGIVFAACLCREIGHEDKY